MITPPKVRRFHLSASESPVAAARSAAWGGAAAPETAAEAAAPQPAVRVELRRGGAAATAGPFDAADDGFGSLQLPMLSHEGTVDALLDWLTQEAEDSGRPAPERAAVEDDTAITLADPVGTFRRASNKQEWSIGAALIYGIDVEVVELL